MKEQFRLTRRQLMRQLILGTGAAGILSLVNISCSEATPTPSTPELRKLPVTLTPEGKTSIKYGAIKNATKMTLIANREIMDRMCEDPKYKPLEIGVGQNLGVSVIFAPGSLGQITSPVSSIELASLRRIHEIEQGFNMKLQGIGFKADESFRQVLERKVPQSFYERALAEELSIGWVASMIKGVNVLYGDSGPIGFTAQQLNLIIGSAVLPIDVVAVPQEYWDRAKSLYKDSINFNPGGHNRFEGNTFTIYKGDALQGLA